MNDLILFIFLALGFAVTVLAIINHKSPGERWKEVQQMEIVTGLFRWEQIRKGNYEPIRKDEVTVKHMSAPEFDYVVIQNLRKVGLEEEAQNYIDRTRQRRNSEKFSTAKSSPLSEWEIEYK